MSLDYPTWYALSHVDICSWRELVWYCTTCSSVQYSLWHPNNVSWLQLSIEGRRRGVAAAAPSSTRQSIVDGARFSLAASAAVRTSTSSYSFYSNVSYVVRWLYHPSPSTLGRPTQANAAPPPHSPAAKLPTCRRRRRAATIAAVESSSDIVDDVPKEPVQCAIISIFRPLCKTAH